MNTSRGTGEPLTDLENTLAEVEQVPKVEKIERRFNRRGQVVVIISLLVALGSVVWNGVNTINIAQNEARSALTEEGVESLRAANRQLEAKGLPQIPLPDEGEAVDADAMAAAAAAILYDQIEDDPSFRGPEGFPGRPGQPGEGGKPGEDGEDGTDGSRGQDGEDGRSVTSFFIDSDGNLWVDFDDPAWPSMMIGHVVGPTGPKGDKGDTGDTGPMGPVGPVGPSGNCPLTDGMTWHYETRTVVTTSSPLGESMLVCVPD